VRADFLTEQAAAIRAETATRQARIHVLESEVNERQQEIFRARVPDSESRRRGNAA